MEDYLDRAVSAVETNRISHAFLHWAARGQGLEPVHDLLEATARRDVASARRAAAAVGRVGATSGADLCLGLLQAARYAPSPDLSGLSLSP